MTAHTRGTFVAIDLGASSGRVMLADVSARSIELREVHRFANRPVQVGETLYWDVLALWAGTIDGLRKAGHLGDVVGVGVDSWAIDYALLDADAKLIGNPVHYRDRRSDGVAEEVGNTISERELYALTGVQPLPFNTVYQWVSARSSSAMRNAARALLIPDLFNFWLTGRQGTELTNASTTGLLDVTTGEWAREVFRRLGLREGLLPALTQPGEVLGPLLPQLADHCALGHAQVTAVGTHDTASAVVGLPARDCPFAFISSGTWSLVGVELDRPMVVDAARRAGFSNELGIDGTVRFLRNIMGLWLLQESLRTWRRAGHVIDLARLLSEAEALPAGRFVVDPDRPEFLPPGDMPARLRAECRRTGQAEPQTPAEVTRCIVDSLADAYRRAIRSAAELSGRDVDVVHMVGGGARNPLLCQLTADACGLPVVAGPAEATAYGNVLVQARGAGVVTGGLPELRALMSGVRTVTYYPRTRAARLA